MIKSSFQKFSSCPHFDQLTVPQITAIGGYAFDITSTLVSPTLFYGNDDDNFLPMGVQQDIKYFSTKSGCVLEREQTCAPAGNADANGAVGCPCEWWKCKAKLRRPQGLARKNTLDLIYFGSGWQCHANMRDN